MTKKSLAVGIFIGIVVGVVVTILIIKYHVLPNEINIDNNNKNFCPSSENHVEALDDIIGRMKIIPMLNHAHVSAFAVEQEKGWKHYDLLQNNNNNNSVEVNRETTTIKNYGKSLKDAGYIIDIMNPLLEIELKLKYADYFLTKKEQQDDKINENKTQEQNKIQHNNNDDDDDEFNMESEIISIENNIKEIKEQISHLETETFETIEKTIQDKLKTSEKKIVQIKKIVYEINEFNSFYDYYCNNRCLCVPNNTT